MVDFKYEIDYNNTRVIKTITDYIVNGLWLLCCLRGQISKNSSLLSRSRNETPSFDNQHNIQRELVG